MQIFRIVTGLLIVGLLVPNLGPVMAASSAFKEVLSTKDIRAKYKSSKDEVKILIVPGHDDKYAGALYNNIREADLTLKLGNELYAQLKNTKGVEVSLLRTEKGYSSDFSSYMVKNLKDILEWKSDKQTAMAKHQRAGRVLGYSQVSHNNALPSVATILYGINKYANDNDFDIVLHIHFNDYPGHGALPGSYTGFSIYVPQKQFGNAGASMDLAKKVRDQLALVSASSNLPKENAITEDQELIAIGANNTVDAAVILTEYGYVYEPHFADPKVMGVVMKELARQTSVGVLNYLGNKRVVKSSYPVFDDYTWKKNLSSGSSGLDVLALQDFLHEQKYYPVEATLNSCQLHGQYDGCLVNALRKFQKENRLKVDGKFNEATRKKINAEAGG